MYRFAFLRLAAISLLVASATSQAADKKPFLAGAATSNITPWLGDLQAVRIGELGISAIPFEVFSEIGLELKARNPFKPSFTIELANGGYGYLPSPEQHKLGGYETWLGTNKVEVQASVKIINALLKMFAQLK
jgi:hypothetical protein